MRCGGEMNFLLQRFVPEWKYYRQNSDFQALVENSCNLHIALKFQNFKIYKNQKVLPCSQQFLASAIFSIWYSGHPYLFQAFSSTHPKEEKQGILSIFTGRRVKSCRQRIDEFEKIWTIVADLITIS